MDLRKQKTIKSIKNAFLALRSKKPLYKITVKELCEMAEISKPTFYLHYQDIYDLSDKMEMEIIDSIISGTDFVKDPFTDFSRKHSTLFQAFFSQGQILNIIFSHDRKAEFANKLEKAFRQKIFENFPEYKEDYKAILVIDFMVYGCFHTTMMHQDIPLQELTSVMTTCLQKFLVSLDLLKD